MYYLLLGILIYVFLLIVFTNNNKIMSEIHAIIVLVFITFMIGLRFEVGVDYQNYKTSFDLYYQNFTFEYLYFILRYVIKVCFDKFHYLNFMMIMISNIFIYLGLKKRKVQRLYIVLAIIIYSSNMAIIFMNIMRQGVSLAIFFYSSTFIRERNLKKYVLYILLASGFHLSSLFMIPLYFLPRIKINKVSFYFAIITAYFFVQIRLINNAINLIASSIPIYSKYYNDPQLMREDINILSFGVLINVLFFCLLLFVTNREQEHKLEISYYQIGILFNVLSISTFMIDRIGMYFSVFSIVAIPELIKSIKNQRLRLIFIILAVSIAIGLATQTLLINPHKLNLEYNSIFNR